MKTQEIFSLLRLQEARGHSGENEEGVCGKSSDEEIIDAAHGFHQPVLWYRKHRQDDVSRRPASSNERGQNEAGQSGGETEPRGCGPASPTSKGETDPEGDTGSAGLSLPLKDWGARCPRFSFHRPGYCSSVSQGQGWPAGQRGALPACWFQEMGLPSI